MVTPNIQWLKPAMRLFRKFPLPTLLFRIAVPAFCLSLLAALYVREYYKDDAPNHQTGRSAPALSTQQNQWGAQHAPSEEKPWGAYFLLFVWALVPPIVFCLDWILQHDPRYRWLYGRRGKKPISDPEAEYYLRGYELARNVWVAFLLVLAAIMRIKWPFGGD